jgi:chemotaxis protein methyltransferase CheR
MTPAAYDYLRNLFKTRSGLSLSADKQYLVESRLLPLVRKTGLTSIAELVERLNQPHAEMLSAAVVEAMTTNESFLLRDKVPLDHLRNVMMPALMQARAGSKHIRIWCAAAAAGQEPYSLAMCLREMADQLAGWRIDILATDLSNDMVERTRLGMYTQFEAQRGLPINLLLKYFTQVGDQWQIAQDIRDMVRCRPINLMNDFGALGQFDIVFCRNVLIYFDQPTKTATFDRLARVTARDGYLVLGAAETVVGLTEKFKPVPERRGLYAPNPAASKPSATVLKFAAPR